VSEIRASLLILIAAIMAAKPARSCSTGCGPVTCGAPRSSASTARR
jgi:hypothetical protein